ncbi:hypothetical protein C8Q79DRAFT_970967 [Trametes meyenii]|nr:hypothetical protein C8Q79DRAFT_970967 [Trametes meyenii]
MIHRSIERMSNFRPHTPCADSNCQKPSAPLAVPFFWYHTHHGTLSCPIRFHATPVGMHGDTCAHWRPPGKPNTSECPMPRPNDLPASPSQPHQEDFPPVPACLVS